MRGEGVEMTDLMSVVHFANSAHLLDMLTQSQVRGFRFRMFTDRFVRLHVYSALN
jgi:hypothetical protein